MIGAGVALIEQLHWVLYLFGALLVGSGFRMALVTTEVQPEKNVVIQWARRLTPVTPGLHGQKFRAPWNGRMALTPLALVLLMVETTDLAFALDSIPAVFAVTTKPFIVFTSNVFAILGLRSLYFVLAGALGYFRYLKYGLSLVLVFVGVKMLIDPHDQPALWFRAKLPIGLSLAIVAGLILCSIVFSVAAEAAPPTAVKFLWSLAPPQPLLAGQLAQGAERFAVARPMPPQSRAQRPRPDHRLPPAPPQTTGRPVPATKHGELRSNACSRPANGRSRWWYFGDYNVDGVTSTALLVEVLDRLGWSTATTCPTGWRKAMAEPRGGRELPPEIPRPAAAGGGLRLDGGGHHRLAEAARRRCDRPGPSPDFRIRRPSRWPW